jgi:hypothetical protein
MWLVVSLLADPFGWQEAGVLHLFAERYDYGTRHGVIDRLALDASLQVIDTQRCLREPWHLSYPLVFAGLLLEIGRAMRRPG